MESKLKFVKTYPGGNFLIFDSKYSYPDGSVTRMCGNELTLSGFTPSELRQIADFCEQQARGEE
ncbi:MAG: hypothetical protein EOM12_11825 [Verrucomicrobiae bacterium]|nr:hypothetical protein [Verrucomicrobiae bacterium]